MIPLEALAEGLRLKLEEILARRPEAEQGFFSIGGRAHCLHPDTGAPLEQHYFLTITFGAENISTIRGVIEAVPGLKKVGGISDPRTAPVLPFVQQHLLVNPIRITAETQAALELFLDAIASGPDEVFACGSCRKPGGDQAVPFCGACGQLLCSLRCWNAHQLERHS